jgi:hypothetical protein
MRDTRPRRCKLSTARGSCATRGGSAKWATAKFGGCYTWQPAVCCGVMRHCGVRSKHGSCAWHSASEPGGHGWRWRANSRSSCTPCGATGRYSSGGVPRHRHKPRQHRPRVSSSYCRPRPETAVKFSREGGTGWDASEATRLVRAALRATPTTRMAPSRSNFPYPAPITASKREEKAVTSGRSDGDPAHRILGATVMPT